jgi:hypothetical protein
MAKTKSSKNKPHKAIVDAPSEPDVSDLEIVDAPEAIEEPVDSAPLDDAPVVPSVPKLSPQAAQEARLRRARLKAASRRR